MPAKRQYPNPHDVKAPSVQIMWLYARMSKEERQLLLNAAEIIYRGRGPFDDTSSPGELETRFNDFDSKR